ncbi:Aste57867_3588 [Aphanomyces stellatus]|nr:hypothetical protein As57867_003577 [Aphanomyces stellatus]VFT80749.1 Aste57867_3588 [Aphanomyces stellatus]
MLFMAPETRHALYTQATAIQPDLEALKIEIVQYAQRRASAPVDLLRAPLFAPTDPAYMIFAWMFMGDWVQGLREVVSLQGDVSTLTLLSSYYNPLASTPNRLEIPTNVAYYCQLCLQYTTTMVFLLTFFALVYAAYARGYIEGFNMFEVNRVGGIVWVGRPFLLLRSLVAILTLATSTVQLQVTGAFTTIHIPTPTGIQWLSTLLAGAETCWLVIVLTDVGLVVTKDLTNSYSLLSSIVGTILSIALSVAQPVRPSFGLARMCDVAQLDFQLTCHAGVIHIGSATRVVQLLVLTSTVVVVCFAFEKWRHPNLKLPTHRLSLLLPAGGHYLYHKDPWIFHETLYLDKASAFMCGLVSVSTPHAVYLLDTKTWRTHVIKIDKSFDPRLLTTHLPDQRRIARSIPLVD